MCMKSRLTAVGPIVLRRSINPLERAGFTLFSWSAPGAVARTQQFACQAAVADLLARVELRAGAGPRGRLQDGARLLARLAGAGRVDDAARPLGRGRLLRARRAGLRRSQVEVGRDQQRRARLDREFVGPDSVHPER